MASDEIRVRAVVRGRVQAVGYRAFAQHHARSAGLGGTVRNLPEGTVEVVLQGPRDDVERVLEQLRRGPSMARVDSVDVDELEATGELPSVSVTA